MTTKVVSGTIATQVILGVAPYGASLTITTTGVIIPALYGDTAVAAIDSLPHAFVLNEGFIGGAAGAIFDNGDPNGGFGIDIPAAGAVRNEGTILGGTGGYDPGISGGTGGPGVCIGQAGVVRNYGVVDGGNGGRQFGLDLTGGVGAPAVQFADGGTVSNQGVLVGGYGTYGDAGGGAGAAGIVIRGYGQAGTNLVSNNGTIEGGNGGDAGFFGGQGGTGGDGVDVYAGGTLINHGLIFGGAGGAAEEDAKGLSGAGVSFNAPGMVLNSGSIAGGYGGGVGVYVGGRGHLDNTGTITGGASADPNYGPSTIGAGLYLSYLASGVNRGAITGGAGATSFIGRGGDGGAGVVLSYATLTNAGRIAGGTGGIGYSGPGAGGAGAQIDTEAVLLNRGTITGGQGGASRGSPPAAGGVGVNIDGGTLIAAGGLIEGGAGKIQPRAAAVTFGTYAGTLEIVPGAAFEGAIVADPAARDRLLLAGPGAGTLSGFGTSITGFSYIDETRHADWTLRGTIAGAGTMSLGSHATLTLDATVSIATLAFAGPGDVRLDQPAGFTSTMENFATGDRIDLAHLAATALSYANGTLSVLDGTNVVDQLLFDGTYSIADFALKSVGPNTEILYVGQPYRWLTDMPEQTLWHFHAVPG